MSRIRITELDYDQILANLRTFFQSQDEFRDYNFEGSGLSFLLKAMAYNTHYGAYYANMVANEMFPDTAILERSLYAHAKSLNYLPSSKSAAAASIDIVATPTSYLDATYTLPRYQIFQSEALDGVSYQFVTDEAHTVNKANGVFTFSGVTIRQGRLITEQQAVSLEINPYTRFKILNTNIDTSTLTVAVRESSTSSNVTTFTRATDATEVTSNSSIFYLEKSTSGHYTVYFGDGVLGSALEDGNIVVLTYIATDGKVANGVKKFATALAGGLNADVTTATIAAGGGEAETADMIRYNAPIYYTTQNRAVNENDFPVIIKQRFPKVDSVSIWGGQDNDPPIYGKVFISVHPKQGYVLNTTEKAEIVDLLTSSFSVVTISPVIVDPKYTYVKTAIEAQYDSTRTTLSNGQIKALIRSNIIDYNEDNLGKFESKFVSSEVSRIVNNSDASIVGNRVNIVLEKRFAPVLNTKSSWTFNFETRLQRGSAVYGLTSSQFSVIDSDGELRNVYLDESPLGYTGIDSIDVTNPGYGYLTPPTVTITGDGSGATAVAKINNGKIEKITVTNRGIGYTAAQVTLTSDSGNAGAASPVLSARYGTIRTYYVNDKREKVFVNLESGSINYDTGVVTLVNFEPAYYTGMISIRIPTDNPVIKTKRGNILIIDTTDDDAISVQLSDLHQ